MIHKYVQVQIYREYAIESLKQALANLRSYDTAECVRHITDTLLSIDNMREASNDE